MIFHIIFNGTFSWEATNYVFLYLFVVQPTTDATLSSLFSAEIRHLSPFRCVRVSFLGSGWVGGCVSLQCWVYQWISPQVDMKSITRCMFVLLSPTLLPLQPFITLSRYHISNVSCDEGKSICCPFIHEFWRRRHPPPSSSFSVYHIGCLPINFHV